MAFLCFAAGAQNFSSNLGSSNKPWTSVPTISGDDYKFVVLPDKTGGEDTGIFDLAIQEINRLAPDFVINIGDLIGGYYTDVKYCERDWSDILGKLKSLDAPFFFVGGNHDLTNQLQTDDFVKRFGASYYSFILGPDLFLVLDSEEHGERCVSEEQVEYFRDVLKGWHGRHIYVFMHSPLWAPDNHGGYEYIAEMLKGRQYTVFSGHTHQYYYEERDGMDHFVLATAGGDSERRGQLMGEFDHIMLVSAREGKPAIANIPIGSLIPNDIVDKSTMPLVMWMMSGKYAAAPYLMLDSPAPSNFDVEFSVRNPFDQPMSFSIAMPEGKGFVFSEPLIDGELEPSSEKKYVVSVDNPHSLEPGKLVVKTGCSYLLKGIRQSVANNLDILTDHVRTLARKGKMTIISRDHYEINESWDWHGTDDGWFEFDVETSGSNLLVTVRTHDDICALDKVGIIIESGGRRYEDSYNPESAQMKLPLRKIKGGQFTLNVRFTDNDDPEEGDPSVLWWRLPSRPGQFRIAR